MIIAVCGHGGHGKGTVSRLLSQYTGLGYFESTSQAAAELVYKHTLDSHGYDSIEDCWNDRRNHRKLWHTIIRAHNQPLGITLYADMVRKGNQIIDGIRDIDEFLACKQHGLFDTSIWVDASGRVKAESSCTVRPTDCDVVIDNRGAEELLKVQIYSYLLNRHEMAR